MALSGLRERYETLSPREREVMVRVTTGRLNKQTANDIGITESTVKVHRTNLMRKMKARSLPSSVEWRIGLSSHQTNRNAPNSLSGSAQVRAKFAKPHGSE